MRLSQQQQSRIEQNVRQYISAYDLRDPKIALKAAHTFRVAALSRTIARSAAPELEELSWLCGILHDIGRFEQVRRYHTFIDAQSVDHASFGADLLFSERLLEKLIPPDVLTAEERRLLELSIRSHSALAIPEELPESDAACCNILRDADKIDIFRVNCETPLEDIYNVSTRELKTASVSQPVKECFLAGTAVPRALRKSPVDSLVGHICLTFELVYPVSTAIAKRQGYVRQLASFQSENPETEAWFAYMRNHLWRPASEACP